jgi:hypothetical protein
MALKLVSIKACHNDANMTPNYERPLRTSTFYANVQVPLINLITLVTKLIPLYSQPYYIIYARIRN